MHKLLLPFSLLLMLIGCQSSDDHAKAQQLVDQAIETHGGAAFEQAQLQFRFRDRIYTYFRDGGRFEYRRIFTDSTGQTITDILANEGFVRLSEGDTVQLPEERKQAFSNSVNSVIYFALLPYRLNDEAVQKEYLGQARIKGEPYEKVKVSFRQDGGGEDFEDEFIYWFHRKKHTLDYLAYSYHTEGGGFRFREAYNPREIAGIRWQDYLNYRPESKDIRLEALDSLYEAGSLKLLSRIELNDIQEITEAPQP